MQAATPMWGLFFLLLAPCASGMKMVLGSQSKDGAVEDPPAGHSSAGSKNVAVWSGSYQYMPSQNLLLCTCAKCGSTSLYNFIYKNEFSKPWVYTDRPWIQETWEWRWQGKWQIVEKDEAEKLIKDPKVFSYALIRDPKDRMISAWKSKVSCDSTYFETDTWDRDHMVPNLLKLQGRGKQANCLSFKEFLEVVTDIKVQGKSAKLNEHFLPQHYGCFRDFEPKLWSQTTSVGDGHAATELAKHMHYEEAAAFPHIHWSEGPKKTDPYAGVDIDADTLKMLDAFTSEEYGQLGVSLSRKS